MTNAEYILLLVVGSLLALFILLLVVAAAVGIKILLQVKKLGTKAETVADSVESAANSVETAFWSLGKSSTPLAILKLLGRLAKKRR